MLEPPVFYELHRKESAELAETTLAAHFERRVFRCAMKRNAETLEGQALLFVEDVQRCAATLSCWPVARPIQS